MSTIEEVTGEPIPDVLPFAALSGNPDFKLIQYGVDFKPDEERTLIRKMLVDGVAEELPNYIFDGSIMWTRQRINVDKTLVVLTTRRHDKLVQITMKEVGEVLPTSQFYNNVLDECMEKLYLQALDGNYYDPMAARILRDFKLELWPGYVTSIRQDDHNIQLCCQVSTKVLRTDTVLDQLKQCHKKDSNNFKTNTTKMLLGSLVITRYNNKTYRIDEICWDKTPNDTFELEDGSVLDYETYYANKYNCKVTESKQPLLVSHLREARGGVVYLVPELCNMMGLSDELRDNFHRGELTPDYRVGSLKRFSQRINHFPEFEQFLSDWNLQFTEEFQRFLEQD